MSDFLSRWGGARLHGAPVWQVGLLFCLIALAAVWLGFGAFSGSKAGELVREYGYYYIAAVFAWWVIAAVGMARGLGARRLFRVRERLRWRNRGAWALIAFLFAVALVTVPRDYKILFDEAVIQSTAFSMHQAREVAASHRMYEVEGVFSSFQAYLDKRPFFFPFLVSLAHDLTGYREQNAFLINLALFPAVLALMYSLARSFSGRAGGRLALASLGTFSLLAINANGAGLEMLNLTMVLLVIFAGRLYLAKPDDRSLSFLVLSAVLLANTRYESAIYVGCVAILVLEGWRRAGRVILPPEALAAPLLLVPYGWHSVYLSSMPKLWELREGTESRFSFQFLEQNLASAWEYFSHVGTSMANSIWLSMAGLGSALGLAIWYWRRRPVWTSWSAGAAALAICSLGVLANVALLMAYYWGDLSDPVVSRLSLPLHALLALLIAAAYGRLPAAIRQRVAVVGVLAALLVYLAWGVRLNPRLNLLNGMEQASRWEKRFLEERGPARRLIVTDKSPLLWFAHGVPSVVPRRLALRAEGAVFHLARRTFDEILVTQTLSPASGPGEYFIPDEHRMSERFELETIGLHRVGTRLHRISRIVAIHPPRPDAPPEDASNLDGEGFPSSADALSRP